jgi:hypothetical protein
MNVRTTVLTTFALFAAFALPTPTLAVQGGISSSILFVQVNSNPLPPPAVTGLLYGGCMAYLANPLSYATPKPNCPSNWVSFSCDGTYAAKDVASMMLDQAQLAYATKRSVYVVVDDAKKHNGYCLATRLDLR